MTASHRHHSSCHLRVTDFTVTGELHQTFVTHSPADRHIFALPVGAVVSSFSALGASGRVVRANSVNQPVDEQYADEPTATLAKLTGETFQISLQNVNASSVTTKITFAFLVSHAGLSPDSLRITFPTCANYDAIIPGGSPCNCSAVAHNLYLTVAFEMNDVISSISSPTHTTSIVLGRLPSASTQGEHDARKAFLALTTSAVSDKDVVIDLTCQNMDKPRFLRETLVPKGSDAYALTFVPRFSLPPLPRQEYLFLVELADENLDFSRNEAVREAFATALHGLPAQGSTFSLLTYGGHHTSLFWPAGANYSVQNVQQALTRVQTDSDGDGRLDLLSVMQMIRDNYDTPNKSASPTAVIIITQAQRIIQSTDRLVDVVSQSTTRARNRKRLVRYFACAIGDNPPTAALEAITRVGCGASVFIGDDQPLEPPLSRLLVAARGAPIENVSVDWGSRGSDHGSDWDGQPSTRSSPSIDNVSVSSGTTALSFFEVGHRIDQNHGALGPRSDNLSPLSSTQQSPNGVLRDFTLYPGFRQVILAITPRFQGERLRAKITGEVFGQPLELVVPLDYAASVVDEVPIFHHLAAGALIQDHVSQSTNVSSMAQVLRLAFEYSLVTEQTTSVVGQGASSHPVRGGIGLPHLSLPRREDTSPLGHGHQLQSSPARSIPPGGPANYLPVCPSPRFSRRSEPSVVRIPSPANLRPAGYNLSMPYTSQSPVIVAEAIPSPSERVYPQDPFYHSPWKTQDVREMQSTSELTPSPHIIPILTSPGYYGSTLPPFSQLEQKSPMTYRVPTPPGRAPSTVVSHITSSPHSRSWRAIALEQTPHSVSGPVIPAPPMFFSPPPAAVRSPGLSPIHGLPLSTQALSIHSKRGSLHESRHSDVRSSKAPGSYLPSSPSTSRSVDRHSVQLQRHVPQNEKVQVLSNPMTSSFLSTRGPLEALNKPPFAPTWSFASPLAPRPVSESPALSLFSESREPTQYLGSPLPPQLIAYETISSAFRLAMQNGHQQSPARYPSRSPTLLEGMVPEPVDGLIMSPVLSQGSPPIRSPALTDSPPQAPAPISASREVSFASMLGADFSSPSPLSPRSITPDTILPPNSVSPAPYRFLPPPAAWPDWGRKFSNASTVTPPAFSAVGTANYSSGAQSQTASLAVSPYSSTSPLSNSPYPLGWPPFTSSSSVLPHSSQYSSHSSLISPPSGPAPSSSSLSTTASKVESVKDVLTLLQEPSGSFRSTSPLFTLLFSRTPAPEPPRAFVRQLGNHGEGMRDLWSTFLVLAFITHRRLPCEEIVERAMTWADTIAKRDFDMFDEELTSFRERWLNEAEKLIFRS